MCIRNRPVDVRCRGERLARSTTYEDLAAAVIQGRRRVTWAFTLSFVSPVTFKAGQADDLHIPIPLPALVFGSLVDRWNAFSPVPLDANLRQFADQRDRWISQYRLASEMVPQKNKVLRVGGKGDVTYLVLEREPIWGECVEHPAHYALYSGVGAQSATGMGQLCIREGTGAAAHRSGARQSLGAERVQR